MGKTYTRNEILSLVAYPEMLYQRDVVNYYGTTVKAEGGVPYSEIIADFLVNMFDTRPEAFERLLALTVRRTRKDFAFLNHDWRSELGETNRRKEAVCHRMKDKASPWGRIINYQVNVIPDTRINIDLVAYDSVSESVTLITLKGCESEDPSKFVSSDTLLRCLLEAETLYRLICREGDAFLSTLCAYDRRVLTANARNLLKAVWLPEDSVAWREFCELDSRPAMKALYSRLRVRVDCYNARG